MLKDAPIKCDTGHWRGSKMNVVLPSGPQLHIVKIVHFEL